MAVLLLQRKSQTITQVNVVKLDAIVKDLVRFPQGVPRNPQMRVDWWKMALILK